MIQVGIYWRLRGIKCLLYLKYRSSRRLAVSVNFRVFIKLQVWYYSVRSRKINRDQTAIGATMLKCTLRLQIRMTRYYFRIQLIYIK